MVASHAAHGDIIQLHHVAVVLHNYKCVPYLDLHHMGGIQAVCKSLVVSNGHNRTIKCLQS